MKVNHQEFTLLRHIADRSMQVQIPTIVYTRFLNSAAKSYRTKAEDYYHLYVDDHGQLRYYYSENLRVVDLAEFVEVQDTEVNVRKANGAIDVLLGGKVILAKHRPMMMCA